MTEKPTYEKLEQMVKKLKEEVDKHKQTVNVTEKRKLEDRLKQAQKIQELGTLANGIVHDLNNNLQSIFSYTQLLLLDKQSDDPDFEKLKEIEKAAQKASEIILQLLTFSDKISTPPSPT
jgi:C4-dicarboxylate-specific signal transduction histidine kinase